MENFNTVLYQYKSNGMTMKTVSVNDCPLLKAEDLSEWTPAAIGDEFSPIIHGYIMQQAAANNNSINCAVIDYYGHMEGLTSTPLNGYRSRYAVVSINTQGMSGLVIHSPEDDVDFTMNDVINNLTIKIYSTNGFQIVNRLTNTTIMQGGNLTGDEDFSIPLNCCIVHIIRSSTYNSGTMIPTSHFMIFPTGSISTGTASPSGGPLHEMVTPTYKQLVPYFNVGSYYRTYFIHMLDINTGIYYYRMDKSYNPLCKQYGTGYSSIPNIEFSALGGSYHQYSDDYCTLDVQLVADMVNDAVSGIALPDDYITR